MCGRRQALAHSHIRPHKQNTHYTNKTHTHIHTHVHTHIHMRAHTHIHTRIHRLVPLEKLDLRLVQIMYTTGDMAAIRAISPFDITDAANVVDVPWINEQVGGSGCGVCVSVDTCVRTCRGSRSR